MPHFPYTDEHIPLIKEQLDNIKLLEETLKRAEMAKVPDVKQQRERFEQQKEQILGIKRAFFPEI